MLIVISIISILLGMLYGALERAKKFSRRVITFTELKSIESAFKQYHAHYHAWPTNLCAEASHRFESASTGGTDLGFIIDHRAAVILQGAQSSPRGLTITSDDAQNCNPDMIPFLELSRISNASGAPVNPFKSSLDAATDTSRSYKVLFDTDGDRQLQIEDTELPGFRANIIASVAVWTIIPATRKTDSSGQPLNVGDVIFGSWESFNVK